MNDPFSARRFAHLLPDLIRQPGIAGHETAVSAYLRDQLVPVADEVRTDTLGNLIARFGDGDTPRIAVLAHMDTVGFLVKTIRDDGLSVVPVGGVNVKALPGASVLIWPSMESASTNTPIPGVIGVRSQHLARPGDTATNGDELIIQVDPAALSRIAITDPVTYAPQSVALGDHLFASPYLDNRAGCAVLLEIGAWLAQMADHRPATVYLVGTVQEETTCTGALHALRAIQPEAAIFVDGTVSYDTPDTRDQGAVRLGGGPVLTAFLYVSGLNGWHAHPGLRAHLLRLATEHGIPVQQDAVRGLMSDARVAAWLGIPSALIGVPMRGKHAPLETVHLGDLVAAARLLAAALSDPFRV